MSKAVRNLLTGWYGEWRRWSDPPFDAETEELVEIELADIVKPQSQLDAEAAALIASLKQYAQDLKTAMTPQAIFDRSEMLLMKDELNILRAELRDIKARGSVATSTQASIRGIFTPIAALPDRTNANIETGLTNKITADVGNLD